MKKIVFFLFLFCFASAAETLFPVDTNLKKRVDFWIGVYSKIDSDQGYLHDEDDLSIVYSTVSVKGLSEKGSIQKIKEEKKRWSEVIESLINNKKRTSTNEEKILLEKIKNFSNKRLKEMSKAIRFQSGLSDRYFHGLQESYKYLDEIKAEFKKLNMPEKLAYLPHVESSFNYKAYSKVGAAGIWQFMSSTARLYKLKRSHLVDERRDPLLSTQAAINLLKDNYKKFKSWPLAITAYNAGPNGMARAVKKMGTTNLSKIVENYDRGRFGFASKNFYASFIAASAISEKPELYFKKIVKRVHQPFKIVKVSENTKISKLAKNYKISVDELEDLNLALRPTVFKRDMHLPKGYALKVPVGANKKVVAKKSTEKIQRNIASLSNLKPEKENETLYRVKIEPDETLGHYADWGLVPQEKILEINKNLTKKMSVGKEVLLPLEGPNLERFIDKRTKYHANIQESFYNKFKIEGISTYAVKKGDTLEKLTGKLEVPLWLLKNYQKNLKLNTLKIGDTLTVPQIVTVNDSYKSGPGQNQ